MDGGVTCADLDGLACRTRVEGRGGVDVGWFGFVRLEGAVRLQVGSSGVCLWSFGRGL
jgi:hypothetical protein